MRRDSEPKRSRRWARVLLALALLGLAAPGLSTPALAQGGGAGSAGAETAPGALVERAPEALRVWLPWVTRDARDLECPWVSGSRTCVWPGELLLELGESGATFTLEVRVDARSSLTLPGDASRWPRAVRVGALPAMVHAEGERPTLTLPPGTHRVRGELRWSRMPDTLALPAALALVRVVRDGGAAESVQREADGTLRLRERDREPETEAPVREASVTVEVSRLLRDDIPLALETHLRLRVSGEPRELDLGRVLPEGFVPVGVDAPIPARLDPDGNLRVQLRPGDWTLTIHARSEGDLTRFAPAPAAEPWPGLETWALDGSPERRLTEARGAPGVDPRQTTLPAQWHGFPAFQVTAEAPLELVVLTRGEAAPPAERIRVQREMRLAMDGSALLIRDHIEGEQAQTRRLEVLAPALLGRASLGGTDVLITRLEEGGLPGFEVRGESFSARADLVQPRGAALSAVGWSVDVQQLGANLQLPPGWMLVAAVGADRADTAWLQAWGLLDLFLLLLIVLGLRAVRGTPVALLALLVLGVAWHTPMLPRFLWLILIACTALATALAEKRGAQFSEWMRRGALLLLALAAVSFVWEESRLALFPQLEFRGAGPEGRHTAVARSTWGPGAAMDRHAPPSEAAFAESEAYELDEAFGAPQDQRSEGAGRGAALRSTRYREAPPSAPQAAFVDPSAVVQTGPGMPTWSWRSHPLRWSGPVAAEQELRLILLPPFAVSLLRLFSVFGLLALLFLVVRAGPPSPRTPRSGGKGVGASAPPDPDGGAAHAGASAPAASAPATSASPGASTSASALVGGLMLLLASLAVAPAAHASELAAFPSPQLLQELRAAALAPPECGAQCVETARLAIDARGGTLTLTAEVHARTASAWRIPGPAATWQPSEVRINGMPTRALRLDGSGHLLLRVPEGVHRVEVRGPLRERMTLGFGAPPRALDWSTEGWLLDGPRPDAPPPASVHLTREVSPVPGEPAPDEAGPLESELPPSLRLERTLEIGIPWTVQYRMTRAGGSTQALRLRVPLLPGERVVTEGVTEEEEQVVVTLERGVDSVLWTTTLAERDRLVLEAAEQAPWTETWTLACSTLWHCDAEGLTPVARMGADRGTRVWRPRWLPWPGESLTLSFRRPAGVSGQTITVDRVHVGTSGGRRLRTTVVRASLRASRGGRWSLSIPPDAEVQRVSLDGRELPAMHEEGAVSLTLPVGASEVVVELREAVPASLIWRGPALTLEGGATDVRLGWTVPESRWLLWTQGPRWGPVVTLWHWLPVLLIVAFVLGRWAPTPLGVGSWLLLGLGMTQVHWSAPFLVVVWLVALGLREKHWPEGHWRHRFLQFALVMLTFAALIALLTAVVRGLALRPPDMQVVGGGSVGNHLQWYADRSAGPLPQVTLITLPLWVWHVAMLAWALWLAAALVRWVRWGWGAFGAGGIWKRRPVPEPSGQGAGPGGPGGAGGPSGAGGHGTGTGGSDIGAVGPGAGPVGGTPGGSPGAPPATAVTPAVDTFRPPTGRE